MEATDHLRTAAEAKRNESRLMSRAYSTTLSALIPANFLLVVGAALLSLVAGATILIENDLLEAPQAGVLALLSGAFTIVHSKLGCEQYQSECKKLATFYRGMAEDYANLQVISDPDELKKRFFALNDQLSAAIKSSSALPFDWALAKAKKDVSDQR
jgi:hypothetical protein